MAAFFVYIVVLLTTVRLIGTTDSFYPSTYYSCQTKLNRCLLEAEKLLACLMKEKYELSQPVHVGKVTEPVDETLKHYRYIYPLVEEIHLLELKVKEQQKEYDSKKLRVEALRLGEAVLADSMDKKECVLKSWYDEIQTIINTDMTPPCTVSNTIYHVNHDERFLYENLSFTILSQGVSVRVRIRSQMQIPYLSIHLMKPTSACVGVKSDTFIPELDTKVKSSLSDGKSIRGIISFVSGYISEEMAPFVIIIPMKKTKKKAGKCKSNTNTTDKKETVST